MSEADLMAHIEPFRDPQAWEKMPDGSWTCHGSILAHSISLHTGHELDVDDPRAYLQTDLLEKQTLLDDYVLLGRSYMDKRNYKAVEG